MRSWHAAPAITNIKWQEFWQDRIHRNTFSVMWPGVLELLTQEAGNAWGERLFGKAARLISKLSGNLDIERKLALHVNGPLLRIRGYSVQPWVGNVADGEFFVGKPDLREAP